MKINLTREIEEELGTSEGGGREKTHTQMLNIIFSTNK